MSLNDIKLTNLQLVGLYENVLLEAVEKGEPQKNDLNYLGGNLQQVLIVVNKESAAFLTDREFDFLTSILAACKLSIADVAIINWINNAGMTCQEILSELKSKNILLFDLDPIEFGLPLFFPHYQIQPFNNCTFLSAPSLHTIENNVAEKKNFWAALKTLFSI